MYLTNIIIFVTTFTSIYAWYHPLAYHQWIFKPYLVHHKYEWHRLLTHGFIHQDLSHLFLNMLGLDSFGKWIECLYYYTYPKYGTMYFLCLYLSAIMASCIPDLIHKRSPYYASLGASGGISALIFSSILFDPFGQISYFGCFALPGIVWGPIYLGITYFLSKTFSRTNHLAHIAGALYGILFNFLLEPKIIGHFIQEIKDYCL